jgi:hypothetical protein
MEDEIILNSSSKWGLVWSKEAANTQSNAINKSKQKLHQVEQVKMSSVIDAIEKMRKDQNILGSQKRPDMTHSHMKKKHNRNADDSHSLRELFDPYLKAAHAAVHYNLFLRRHFQQYIFLQSAQQEGAQDFMQFGHHFLLLFCPDDFIHLSEGEYVTLISVR